MESKKFYSVKDIILGSRIEYLSLDENLKLLRQMCYTYDKNVEDFQFSLSKANASVKPKIICHFTQNLKTLRGVIIYLQKRINRYYGGMEIGCCIKGENEYYLIDNDYYDAHIRNKGTFRDTADSIIESDFANKMKFGLCYLEKRGSGDYFSQHQLIVFPQMIRYSRVDNSSFALCRYYSEDDVINIKTNDSDGVWDCTIRNIFGYRIPAESISLYQRELIDSSDIVQKPLEIVSEVYNSGEVDLLIEEQNNKVVLRKVKAKDRRKKY